MQALIQRVSQASVIVDNHVVGKIDAGLLVLLGIEKADDEQVGEKLLKKILGYRVFEDDAGKMNCSLTDIKGGLLVVSQFTLAADTKKGLRPSFSSAANPENAKNLFDHFVTCAKRYHHHVQTGQFGAMMDIHLTNSGPVTFMLSV